MIINLFGIGKKKGAPDIGKEDEENFQEEEDNITEQLEKISKMGKKSRGGKQNDSKDIEVERIGAKLEALSSLIKEMNGRFSIINQNIGEIRSMNLTNEKSISKVTKDSIRAIDMVNDVQPDKLRIDFSRLDLKIQQLSEKLESNKQFADTAMAELKDLRRKVNTFMNTEELLKFNNDIKKDLLSTQQLVSKSKLYSDKTEQLFIEIRKGIAENEKTSEKIKNLDNVYDSLQKEISKIRIDFSSIVKRNELDAFKKDLLSKINLTENVVKEVDNIKDEHDRLEKVLETVLGIEEKNQEDIKKVSELNDDEEDRKSSEKIDSILHIIDVLAGQVSEIKMKLKMGKKSKINLSRERKRDIKHEKTKLKNINLK